MNAKTFSMLSMEKKERKNMTNSKRLNFIGYLCQQFRLDSQNWGRVQQEVLPLQTTSRFSPVHVMSLVPRWPEPL